MPMNVWLHPGLAASPPLWHRLEVERAGGGSSVTSRAPEPFAVEVRSACDENVPRDGRGATPRATDEHSSVGVSPWFDRYLSMADSLGQVTSRRHSLWQRVAALAPALLLLVYLPAQAMLRCRI